MCGIVGIVSKNNNQIDRIGDAIKTLSKRGPDNQTSIKLGSIALAHSRLSIIDISSNANQPFVDSTKRYTLVFNGEIYNHLELKKELIADGFNFSTNSDTEVLLNLYIKYGELCLEKLNGFFAFSVFDKQNNTLFIARDRMGIKPLLYYFDGNDFIFSSEMKAIFKFNIDKSIDQVSLFNYLQFNYIPTHNSILKKIKKLKPGCFVKIENINSIVEVQEHSYYQVPFNEKETIQKNAFNYDKSKEILKNLLDDSVKMRLVADVPVGTFLSGGVDSSIISLIAKKYKSNLQTFSIGYKDEPFFDETEYANSVAKKNRK